MSIFFTVCPSSDGLRIQVIEKQRKYFWHCFCLLAVYSEVSSKHQNQTASLLKLLSLSIKQESLMISFAALKKMTQLALIGALLAAFASTSQADPVTLDFESFLDNTPLSNEIPNISIAGGTVLTAGVGLNEIDFPPHSGSNVLAALNSNLALTFADPLNMLSAYFTLIDPLEFSAFDEFGTFLQTVNSPAAANLGSNTLIDFFVPGGASYLIASINPFTLDDLTFGSVAQQTVPEPNTLLLLSAGVMGLLASKRRLWKN